MVKDKGKPRHYDEWQPEYTPKTKKVTKASQRKLDTIRAQALAENVTSSVGMQDGIEVASLIGLAFCFHEGINPVILSLFELGKEALEQTADLLNDFVVWVQDVFDDQPHEEKIKSVYNKSQFELWIGQTVNQLVLEKASMVKRDKDQEMWYTNSILKIETEIHNKTVDLYGGTHLLIDTSGVKGDWKYTTKEGGSLTPERALYGILADPKYADKWRVVQKQIYLKELLINNLHAQLGGGEVALKYHMDSESYMDQDVLVIDEVRVIPWESSTKGIKDALHADIERLQREIDAAIITRKDLDKLRAKMEWINWIVCFGEAGALRWMLKSYEMSELVSNVKPFG